MLKINELVNQINEYMSIMKYYIEFNNDLGNSDINKQSEDFYCGLLNIIYGLELQNLNELKVNFPAIDLGDKKNRVCYQITATSEITKIKETLNAYRKYQLYKEYDEINILILGNKKKHSTKLAYSEFAFSYDKNLYEINDLIKDIAKMKIDKLIRILTYIENNFGDSILEKIKFLKEDKSFLVDKKIVGDKHLTFYSNGLGKVRIDAYLPTSYDKELSCCIMFERNGLSDAYFTFSEEDINRLFFLNIQEGLSVKRNFISYSSESTVTVDFPNTRFYISLPEVQQLCELIQDLYDEYLKCKYNVYSTLGANNFVEIKDGEFKIIELPKDIWICMVKFAQNHDYNFGETPWHIFQTLNLNILDYIRLFNKDDSSILAELYVSSLDSDIVEIIWRPGYSPNIDIMNGFDNKVKWQVYYTHNWILNNFIPYIYYIDFKQHNNLIKRTIKRKRNFEEFKKSFSICDLGITSLIHKD